MNESRFATARLEKLPPRVRDMHNLIEYGNRNCSRMSQLEYKFFLVAFHKLDEYAKVGAARWQEEYGKVEKLLRK